MIMKSNLIPRVASGVLLLCYGFHPITRVINTWETQAQCEGKYKYRTQRTFIYESNWWCIDGLFSQCCDMGYHASLARTFRTYLSAEYNLETSRHEGLDIIENAVDNLDARSDKHKIMDMHNQVFCPPVRFEYQPHMGDEVPYFKLCFNYSRQ